MPKKIEPLSALEVSRLQKAKGNGLHAVGGVPGLFLQVRGDAQSWIVRVTIGLKRRDVGLGSYPGVTLAAAREKARELREQVVAGIDPVMEREKAREAVIAAQRQRITFAEAARRKHAAIAHEFRSRKHAADWLSSLELHAFADVGSMDVCAIEVADVLHVLRPIWETKTETATRVRQRIEAVLSWATVAGFRSGPNPAAWEGNLAELLPKPQRQRKRQHLAALPWQDVPAFMAELRERKGTGARALEFAILTAARSGEVRGMRWEEVDTDAGMWRIPGPRMKAGKAHDVPLSPRALAILREQIPMEGSVYVFAAGNGGRLSDVTLTAVMRRMGHAETVHGTARSSFKDWARSRTRYPDEVSELCLAHVNSDATRAAYARDGLLPQRAALLRDWADFCAHPMADAADVVNIGQRVA